MKILAFMILSVVAGSCAAMRPGPLSDFEWKNRVILVRVNAHNITTAFIDAAADIDDRDIVWFQFSGTELTTNFAGELPVRFSAQIRDQYFSDDELKAVLIGKDGGIKARQLTLRLTELFTLIDGMPMRREEMGY